jgi:nucleoside-diphosphate-sugar epimerase
MRNVLVTGYKGFIGSALTEKLKNSEWPQNVIGIDRQDGNDILDCELPYPSTIDMVIHLAGIGGVRESLADPKKYWDTNVEGTKRILEHYPDVRVLVASSSSQYEPHLNPYAASKHVIEYIPHSNVCFMRFHTVYGPTPRKNMFFDKLLNDKLEYVTNHSRDFIHIEDMCDGIELLMNSTTTGPVDIGTGISVKIKDIRPDLPVKESTPGERQETLADTRLMSLLGHQPKYTVDKFLRGI